MDRQKHLAGCASGPGTTQNIVTEGADMERDVRAAVEVFVERFGCNAFIEAVSRYRDSILAGKAQQALIWRSIADAIESHSDAHALRSMH